MAKTHYGVGKLKSPGRQTPHVRVAQLPLPHPRHSKAASTCDSGHAGDTGSAR